MIIGLAAVGNCGNRSRTARRTDVPGRFWLSCARLGGTPVRGGTPHQDAVPPAGVGWYGVEFVSGSRVGEPQTLPIGGSAWSWATSSLSLGQRVAQIAGLLGAARALVVFDEAWRGSGERVEVESAECGLVVNGQVGFSRCADEWHTFC